MYDIIYDIIHISRNPNPHCLCCCPLAVANLPPAQRSDSSEACNDLDREMDPDEARDYADQGPLPDSHTEELEDNEMLTTLLKHMPSCMNADDIEQLLQEIPVHPPTVVPVRTVQEAVAAGDLPPLDVDAANVFSRSERILQEHVRKHDVNATELRDLIQMVPGLHNPNFNADEVYHNMHEHLMRAVEDGNIKVLDLWEEGDGLQDNTFVKRKA